MIATLAIAVLELLALFWACALLWINAGLRREIAELRAEVARAKKPANSDFFPRGPLPPVGGSV